MKGTIPPNVIDLMEMFIVVCANTINTLTGFISLYNDVNNEKRFGFVILSKNALAHYVHTPKHI